MRGCRRCTGLRKPRPNRSAVGGAFVRRTLRPRTGPGICQRSTTSRFPRKCHACPGHRRRGRHPHARRQCSAAGRRARQTSRTRTPAAGPPRSRARCNIARTIMYHNRGLSAKPGPPCGCGPHGRRGCQTTAPAACAVWPGIGAISGLNGSVVGGGRPAPGPTVFANMCMLTLHNGHVRVFKFGPASGQHCVSTEAVRPPLFADLLLPVLPDPSTTPSRDEFVQLVHVAPFVQVVRLVLHDPSRIQSVQVAQLVDFYLRCPLRGMDSFNYFVEFISFNVLSSPAHHDGGRNRGAWLRYHTGRSRARVGGGGRNVSVDHVPKSFRLLDHSVRFNARSSVASPAHASNTLAMGLCHFFSRVGDVASPAGLEGLHSPQ